MATPKGFRGSSSSHASAYKLQGHADEEIFNQLIGGRVKKDEHTGKTDVIGPDGKTYSVKGGAKKWQIFLYGYERIKKDPDFHLIQSLGSSLTKSLESFPDDYFAYENDKAKCLLLLQTFSKTNNIKKAIKDLEVLTQIIPQDNLYFSSKLKLRQANDELRKSLSNKRNLRHFLDKAMFNCSEVDRIAIKSGQDFIVFEKNDVLEILANNFLVELSNSGNRPTDLNVDGQKVLMTHSSNVVELEVRNDSSVHYRQLRFNMIRSKALDLLNSKSYYHQNLVNNVSIRKIK